MCLCCRLCCLNICGRCCADNNVTSSDSQEGYVPIKDTQTVGIFDPVPSEATRKFVQSLYTWLPKSVKLKELYDTSKIDVHTFVLCNNASRLIADIDAALNKTERKHWYKMMFIVLHVKPEQRLPVRTSEKILQDYDYPQIKYVVDIAYTQTHKIYRCDMNTEAHKKIEKYLQLEISTMRDKKMLDEPMVTDSTLPRGTDERMNTESVQEHTDTDNEDNSTESHHDTDLTRNDESLDEPMVTDSTLPRGTNERMNTESVQEHIDTDYEANSTVSHHDTDLTRNNESYLHEGKWIIETPHNEENALGTGPDAKTIGILGPFPTAVLEELETFLQNWLPQGTKLKIKSPDPTSEIDRCIFVLCNSSATLGAEIEKHIKSEDWDKKMFFIFHAKEMSENVCKVSDECKEIKHVVYVDYTPQGKIHTCHRTINAPDIIKLFLQANKKE